MSNEREDSSGRYNEEALLKEIEKCRHQMHDLALKLGLTNPQVISISQRLDKLIYQYQYCYKLRAVKR